MENREAILSLLIDFGANLSATNVAGNTPLHTAAVRNSKDCIQRLLIRGADRNTVNRTGQTAEKIASLGGFNDIMKTIQDFNDENIIPPPPPMPNLSTQDQQMILNNVLGNLRGLNAKFTVSPLPMSASQRELIEKNMKRQKAAMKRLSSTFSLRSPETPKGEMPARIPDVVDSHDTISDLHVVTESIAEEMEAPLTTPSPEEKKGEPSTDREKAHEALEQFRNAMDSMCTGSVDIEKLMERFHKLEKAVLPFVSE
jgi:hypothetical protein